MLVLLSGLMVFLGVHSLRMVSDGARTRLQQRMGAMPYKVAYALLSVLGFVLIVWGFAIAREMPTMLWQPPVAMRHGAALLTLLAFVLLAAAYVPGNAIKARWHHPMVLAVKVWALSHLLSTGSVAHVLLFGSFLVWAIANYARTRRRERAQGVVYAPGRMGPTVLTVVVGVVAWAVFAFWLHGLWMGIRPLGTLGA